MWPANTCAHFEPATALSSKQEFLGILCLFYPNKTDDRNPNCNTQKKVTISCTRGCLAEVHFEGFYANLTYWEVKDKQTLRGRRNSETLVWFAWNRFSMVPLIYTTCYLPTYMSRTIQV